MSGDETTMEDSHTLRKVNKTVADYSQMYDSVNQPQFTQNGEETEFEQTNESYY